jgi:hypothetical protein
VGPRLDVEAAFVAAGLADQLVAGHEMALRLAQSGDRSVPEPPVPAGPSPGRETAAPTRGGGTTDGVGLPRSSSKLWARLPKPAVGSVRLGEQVLSMSFKNRPRGVAVYLRISTRAKHRAFPNVGRTLRVTGDRFRARVSGTVTQVSITYRDPDRTKFASVVLLVHPMR